jgi:hypothetical protein
MHARDVDHAPIRLQQISREKFLQAADAGADTRGMNVSLLSTLVLLALGGHPSRDVRVPALASDSEAAWVLLHAGSPWVCWSEFEPDCWRRIELEIPPPSRADAFVPDEEEALDPLATIALDDDPTRGIDVRFGFEPGRLWIAVDDRLWVLEPGQRQARFLDAPAGAVGLVRPTTPDCGPQGRVPGVISGRIAFVDGDRCAAVGRAIGCLRPRPKLRRPTGVELRAGLQLGWVRDWSLSPAQPDLGLPATLQTRAGVELLAVLELGFDGPAALRLARSRADLLARDRRRTIPPIVEGPLAEAEFEALRTVACTEAA